ncbi:lysophospholipid acyltransferase family protein [Halalkalibaculum sp. DA384]|uniref:lysophospholipid acyltransferase family protein n=1 Tax=Halalkalibaculum sp. DA384 TaxID=3373606 RepID=UPI0037545F46
MDRPELTLWNIIRSLFGITVFFLVFLMATPVIALLLIVSVGKLTNFLMEKIGPLMMKPVFAASGIRFNIQQHGEPVNRPVVYLVNHSSTVDLLTIIALGLPRIRFVAKWELQYNPLFFIVGRLTGQVFIKRQDRKQAISTLQKSYRRIREQRLSILLAPEGSRKHPGIIGPFKKGPFHMAVDLGYPIVPIYFEGNRELSAGSSLLTRPGEATAHIHPAIDTTDWEKETLEQHIIEIRRKYLAWAGVETDEVDPVA